MRKILDNSRRSCRFAAAPFDLLAEALAVGQCERDPKQGEEHKMSTKWTVKTAAFVLAISSMAGHGSAEKPKSPPAPADVAKAIADASRPAAEHARLNALAGKWTYVCKCWMSPDQPPIAQEGTAERKWILGGLFLEERLSGRSVNGSPAFEGVGLLGYDKNGKNYTWTFACNMASASSQGVGNFDASGKLVYRSTCFCPLEQKEITTRDEIRFEGKDKVVMESYKIDGGKDVKAMEIVYVRKK
jgi:hypothetical protein